MIEENKKSVDRLVRYNSQTVFAILSSADRTRLFWGVAQVDSSGYFFFSKYCDAIDILLKFSSSEEKVKGLKLWIQIYVLKESTETRQTGFFSD